MKLLKQKPVRVNQQTAGNLIKYLKSFPKDAKVVIHNHNENYGYYVSDCQIACNFEHQKETNQVMFTLGNFIERS